MICSVIWGEASSVCVCACMCNRGGGWRAYGTAKSGKQASGNLILHSGTDTDVLSFSLSLCLTLSFCLSVSLPVLLNLFSAIFCTTGKQGESNSRETTNISHLVLLKPLSRVSFFFCSLLFLTSIWSLREEEKLKYNQNMRIPNVA